MHKIDLIHFDTELILSNCIKNNLIQIWYAETIKTIKTSFDIALIHIWYKFDTYFCKGSQKIGYNMHKYSHCF